MSQIPVYLLTGFLGAGKTTLLNRLLENPAFHDTAVIVNEFGLVPVDHDLIRQGYERPMVTTTGCICCTAGSDLRSSLAELLDGRKKGTLPPFSRVIVETTGLADPAPIINSLLPGGIRAFSLRDHAVARMFRLSSVITVVDAEGIEPVLAAHPESLRQIAFADHVVVNRGQADVRAINPTARVHTGNIDPALLMVAGSYSAFGKGEGVQEWLDAEAHAEHGGHFHDLNRHGSVVAVPLLRDEPVDGTVFNRFMTNLGKTAGLLRAKGLVALRDDPSRPALVHAVQHRVYPIQRLQAWPDGVAGTRLVVIGTGLDEQGLRADFAALPTTSPLLEMAWNTIRKGFP